jgi:hypothetical protein
MVLRTARAIHEYQVHSGKLEVTGRMMITTADAGFAGIVSRRSAV